MMHRSLVHYPATILSASGINLHLADGRTIIDACGGAAVAILGHGNKEVIAAMNDQAQRTSYVHSQSYTVPSVDALADSLLAGSPHGLEKAFFVSSGSEAVEAAMKLAKQYFFERGQPQRSHFISRYQAYHGNTAGAMSVSTNLARKAPYEDYGHPHVSHVSPAFAYRYAKAGETEGDFTRRLLRELEDELLRVGPHRVAAFIAETVGGATAGCVVAPRGYLTGVRELCDKYDILLILDEIMCGSGRCGTFFAFSYDEARDERRIEPDIVVLAKGLGGGYAPIAGVMIHGRVVDVLRRGPAAFNHGHTYQAHPVGCAAALAVQQILKRYKLVEQCANMGAVLERELRRQLAGCRSVGDIRGRGLFWAVEFVRDQESKATFEPAIGFARLLEQEAFNRGLAVYPGSGTVDGVRGDHVLLAPPYTVSEEQLQLICQLLRESIDVLEQEFMAPHTV
jgi:adenosylmethionine-8-amino-7-oxononanoate aminotransferase